MKLHIMAWRNVLRNKRRTSLSVLAIALAAMSILFLFSLLSGLALEMRENLQRYYFGEIRLQHSDFEAHANLNPLYLSIENASVIINELNAQGLFATVGGRMQFPASVYLNNENTGILMTGLNLDSDPIGLQDYIIEGRLPQSGEREIVLGHKLASDLGLSVGDKFTAVTMTLRRSSNGMTFEVVGIVALPLNDLNQPAYLAIDLAQRFAKMGDRVIDIVMRPNNGISRASAMRSAEGALALSQAMGINLKVTADPWNAIPSAYTFIVLAQLTYYIIGAVFYVLASTVIINTIMMIIFERTKEIGTLASMGMESGNIVGLFFLEALFISAVGSVLGVFIGSILTLILEQTGIDFTQALGEIDFQISGVVYPKLRLFNIVIAVITGILVASGISLIPSRRAAKIKPVEAMRAV